MSFFANLPLELTLRVADFLWDPIDLVSLLEALGKANPLEEDPKFVERCLQKWASSTWDGPNGERPGFDVFKQKIKAIHKGKENQDGGNYNVFRTRIGPDVVVNNSRIKPEDKVLHMAECCNNVVTTKLKTKADTRHTFHSMVDWNGSFAVLWEYYSQKLYVWKTDEEVPQTILVHQEVPDIDCDKFYFEPDWIAVWKNFFLLSPNYLSSRLDVILQMHDVLKWKDGKDDAQTYVTVPEVVKGSKTFFVEVLRNPTGADKAVVLRSEPLQVPKIVLYLVNLEQRVVEKKFELSNAIEKSHEVLYHCEHRPYFRPSTIMKMEVTPEKLPHSRQHLRKKSRYFVTLTLQKTDSIRVLMTEASDNFVFFAMDLTDKDEIVALVAKKTEDRVVKMYSLVYCSQDGEDQIDQVIQKRDWKELFPMNMRYHRRGDQHEWTPCNQMRLNHLNQVAICLTTCQFQPTIWGIDVSRPEKDMSRLLFKFDLASSRRPDEDLGLSIGLYDRFAIANKGIITFYDVLTGKVKGKAQIMPRGAKYAVNMLFVSDADVLLSFCQREECDEHSFDIFKYKTQ